MKKHKRIEITAFRRRVTIISGEHVGLSDVVDLQKTQDGDQENIESNSAEGQEILREAIQLMERSLTRGGEGIGRRQSADSMGEKI